MMERPLLTADELKSIPKGSFIVQKTGCHPMRTRLRLFLEWGITFEEEYRVEEQAARRVYYADQNALTRAIVRKYPPKLPEQKTTRSVKGEGQLHDTPVQEMVGSFLPRLTEPESTVRLPRALEKASAASLLGAKPPQITSWQLSIRMEAPSFP